MSLHWFVITSYLCFLFQELSSLLSMEAMSIVTEDRKAAQESTFPNTYTFDLFGGIDVSSKFCFFSERKYI